MCLLALGFPHLQPHRQVGTPCSLRNVVSLSLPEGRVPVYSMTFLFQEGRGLVEFSKGPELTSSLRAPLGISLILCFYIQFQDMSLRADR